MLSLTDAVLACLEGPERQHISSVSVSEDNILCIIADSPAWASRLRFHNDRMLEAARQHGIHAARCRVKVNPHQA
ncbi:MAG: DciA family protein [Pseudomonadota bacterium]